MPNVSPSSPIIRRLLNVSVVFVCSGTVGCAAMNQATRTAADVALPAPEEEKLGERFSAQVDKEFDMHPNPAVQQYLRELGGLAVKAAFEEVPKGIGFSFNVIDAPDQINAFAGPGGEIYFFSGLLRAADDTSEVLAVMCHEVAHVTERHIAQRLVAMHGVNILASAALGEKPSLIEQLVAGIVAQGFFLKYSRDHESQADASGFRYMVDTGYDPHGFISFFEKLQGKGGSPPEFLSSHPNPENRIKSIRTKIKERGNVSDKRGREEHQQLLERLEPQKTSSRPGRLRPRARAVADRRWELVEF